MMPIIACAGFLAGIIFTLAMLTLLEIREHGWRNDR